MVIAEEVDQVGVEAVVVAIKFMVVTMFFLQGVRTSALQAVLYTSDASQNVEACLKYDQGLASTHASLRRWADVQGTLVNKERVPGQRVHA